MDHGCGRVAHRSSTLMPLQPMVLLMSLRTMENTLGPHRGQTYEYAKTIGECYFLECCHQGKILIIGGGIANFTNVAATFKGIIRALREYNPPPPLIKPSSSHIHAPRWS
ncbi:hypothetical protein BGW80DRAFT_1518915 [Lactifluus volemus]|nr:hypothetical protein BGW80DRAFT_1518915 [Lactifluus volemus]